MADLGCLGIILMFIISLSCYYVAIPFLLMKVLAAFGVVFSFWVCAGICFLIYIVVGLFKR